MTQLAPHHAQDVLPPSVSNRQLLNRIFRWIGRAIPCDVTLKNDKLTTTGVTNHKFESVLVNGKPYTA